MSRSVEAAKLSSHHASKASGLRDQLAGSIFSDDDDAIEALEAKAARYTKAADEANAINRAWRKGGRELVAQKWGEKRAAQVAESAASFSWRATKPLDATNIRAEARRCRKRIEEIKRLQARSKRAQDAGGVAVEQLGETCGKRWVRLVFEEKPERSVLQALKAADFSWNGGGWIGDGSAVPAEALDLISEAERSRLEPPQKAPAEQADSGPEWTITPDPRGPVRIV